MQQLEKALLDLTERAELLPLDVLIDRIETQLTSESELPTVADHQEEPGTSTHTRTGVIIQATTQHESTEPHATPQPLRSRRAWAFAAAFILTLAAVGIAAMVLRSDEAPVTDELQPVSTTVTTTPAVIADSVGSWQVTRLWESWSHSIVDVATLPVGGFVVAVDHNDASVLWSPDGINWAEADPQRQVVAEIPGDRLGQPQVISASADRVFVLDEHNRQVWVGDLEAKAWAPVRLDTAGLLRSIKAAAIASNDDKVLVVARGTPLVDEHALGAESYYLTDHVVWLIDPTTGGVERHTLPLDLRVDSDVYPPPAVFDLGLAAVWFQDRWVIATGSVTAVSRDGNTWTIGPGLDRLAAEKSSVTSLVAGTDGLIMTTLGWWGWSGFTLYSEDGLEWARIPEGEAAERFEHCAAAVASPAGATYSDSTGFVMVIPECEGIPSRVDLSPDGLNWSSINTTAMDSHERRQERQISDVSNLAASGTTIFVDDFLGRLLLTGS